MLHKLIDVKTEHVSNYLSDYAGAEDGKNYGYLLTLPIMYYSKRYNKTIKLDMGFLSDGATGAIDINSFGWLFHDKLCNTGTFADGTECNNWQASKVLSDILAEEGRWFRTKSWFVFTWLFGGGRARDNGMY